MVRKKENCCLEFPKKVSDYLTNKIRKTNNRVGKILRKPK